MSHWFWRRCFLILDWFEYAVSEVKDWAGRRADRARRRAEHQRRHGWAGGRLIGHTTPTAMTVKGGVFVRSPRSCP